MTKKFRDAVIFYRFFNRKTEIVNIFLHGWGCNHQSFMFCHKYMKNSCLFIDFPPFGKSSSEIKDWNIFTYSNMVISLCEHLGIKKFNLIGHSFGGRVAIILSVICKNEINKLVLVDSAGLRPRRSLRYYFNVLKYKIRKKLNLDVSKFGSSDYLKLNDNMKKIFINIVNTYLDDFLPYILCPTLIIFGEDDKTTPLFMAKKFSKKIKNNKLEILSNAGHFCFIDRRLKFLQLLKDFLN